MAAMMHGRRSATNSPGFGHFGRLATIGTIQRAAIYIDEDSASFFVSREQENLLTRSII